MHDAYANGTLKMVTRRFPEDGIPSKWAALLEPQAQAAEKERMVMAHGPRFPCNDLFPAQVLHQDQGDSSRAQ